MHFMQEKRDDIYDIMTLFLHSVWKSIKKVIASEASYV